MLQTQLTVGVAPTAIKCCTPFSVVSDCIYRHEVRNMKLQDFLSENPDLEIPFQPETRQKYPDEVWEALHRTAVETVLQNEDKPTAASDFVAKVIGGDDLGGLTVANVLSMWIQNILEIAQQIVASAFLNDKIEADYEDIVIAREIKCTKWHSKEEKKIVDEGGELEEHTHTIRHIPVDDDVRDDFSKLVTLILQDFDSDTYGELPDDYKESNMPDFESFLRMMGGGGGAGGLPF